MPACSGQHKSGLKRMGTLTIARESGELFVIAYLQRAVQVEDVCGAMGAHKMLRTRGHAVPLHAAYISRPDQPAEYRILGEAFEAAASQRTTLDVDGRGKVDVCRFGDAFGR